MANIVDRINLYGTISALVSTRDDESSPTVTYFGIADALTTDDEPKWCIKRFTIVGGVTIGELAYRNGNDIAHNVWTNRATLSYK